MTDRIINLLTKIKKSGLNLKNTHEDLYNPCEVFFENVSHKELCHTLLLADLLNPKGRHKHEYVFLRNFLDIAEICQPDYSNCDVHVITERPVQRFLTSGDGKRRIDILIEFDYKNSNEKSVIIIENKLNNAAFQEKQIEDYQIALKHEGFIVLKSIVLCNNLIENINPDLKYMYCNDLVRWLKECENIIKNEKILYGYIQWLDKQSYKNITLMDAKRLLQLDFNNLKEVVNLVSIYNKGIVRAREERLRDYIEEYIHRNSQDIKLNKCEYVFKNPYLQIWSPIDYEDKRNNLWVEVYFNEKDSVIKIASDRIDNVDFSQEHSCLSRYIQCGESKFYQDNSNSFVFPNEDEDHELFQEVVKILLAVSSFRKEQSL